MERKIALKETYRVGIESKTIEGPVGSGKTYEAIKQAVFYSLQGKKVLFVFDVFPLNILRQFSNVDALSNLSIVEARNINSTERLKVMSTDVIVFDSMDKTLLSEFSNICTELNKSLITTVQTRGELNG